ncbi:MAG: inositol monophosphatase [Ruminococcaceae bacterium]|nr:inositol monophosphatase [Oscillospiraceae bacterium]
MSDFTFIPALLREAAQIMLSADHVERQLHAKGGSQNFVTDYDIRTENFLREQFARLLPEADMLGEESSDTHAVRIAEGLTLIVDPIDGTTNFMQDYRQSCISVGVCDRGTMVYGAIYNPYADAMFTSSRGQGAFVEEGGVRVPLHVSSRDLCDSLVLFGTSPYYRETLAEPTFRTLWGLFQKARDIRRSGSAALDLANIAAGRCDVFFEYLLSPWDYAAGSLLITEAGGHISQMDASPLRFDTPCPVIAGGKRAYAELLNGGYIVG